MPKRSTVLATVAILALVAFACSDRSPTAPEAEAAISISAESSDAVFDSTTRPAHSHSRLVSPRGDAVLPPGVWGSTYAGLTVHPGGATLQVFGGNMGTGGCYGSFAELDEPIPNRRFALSGTFTQLTGVYPGRTQYEALISGDVDADRISVSIRVPGNQQTLGPFILEKGVSHAWTPCLYP